MSPRRVSASFARRIVSSMSAEARARSCEGSEKTSSIVPRSVPIDFWTSITRGPWGRSDLGFLAHSPISPERIWGGLPAPASRMIRETFVHIDGVGYRTEERLWRSGVRTWDDFSATGRPPRIGPRLAKRMEDEIERSQQALRSGRHRYFARKLPSRDQWRAFEAFRSHILYLDIETTGWSLGRHAVTVVGVYDGRRKRSFVQGENLEALPAAVRRAKLLVTFNGSRFDLPFLR